MPIRAVCASGFALALCLVFAPRTMAKPPDLPQPTHPDLTPSQPDIFFVPLIEPFAPLSDTKTSEEEQETKTGQSAKCGCPFTCPLCGILSGPLCSWLWNQPHEETRPIEPQQVFGSYDLSDLIHEAVGNNVQVGPSKKKQVQDLIRHIEERVRPGSWEGHGGKGSIEYNSEVNSLVIRADEETQQQVNQLLEDLRQMQGHRGAEEASSEPMVVKPFAPTLVAMGHDVTDLLSGHDADEVVRELVRVIETTIAPKSWVNRGGSGQLHYNPELKTFFVVQTEDVQEAIRELINLKRSENALKKGDTKEPQDQLSWRPSGYEFLIDEKEPVSELRDAHRDLLSGRRDLAEQLVRKALAHDRKAVLAHPLVYKMQLLHQVLAEPVKLAPHMPGVDPGVVRAYHEILELAPKKSPDAVRPVEVKEAKPAVLEVVEEACELELVPAGTPGKPALCVDKDGQRVRVQLQFCGLTIKLLDEGKGKSSLTIGWSLTSPSK